MHGLEPSVLTGGSLETFPNQDFEQKAGEIKLSLGYDTMNLSLCVRLDEARQMNLLITDGRLGRLML
ncbi:unnamed protein product [Protopolystoma xenopodis]|uniref:Uncharacterized protein n=1 Tax=Protopolystoma xenopodis TaxID=117903 RepID=A0A448XET9_9PLAT|nr:unnamed protein product [Protopolystoma xenopodis]